MTGSRFVVYVRIHRLARVQSKAESASFSCKHQHQRHAGARPGSPCGVSYSKQMVIGGDNTLSSCLFRVAGVETEKSSADSDETLISGAQVQAFTLQALQLVLQLPTGIWVCLQKVKSVARYYGFCVTIRLRDMSDKEGGNFSLI
jgi:hypothetical protein